MSRQFVLKRDGSKAEVRMDKITSRIRHLCGGLNTDYVDPVSVALKVVQGIYNGVTTRELDHLAAEICAYSSTYHPDWSVLAARIVVSDLHKQTDASFVNTATKLFNYKHPKTGKPSPLMAEDVYQIVVANGPAIEAAIDYTRDFDFDYFGFKTLEKSYLLRCDGEVSERPQQMFMRVAIGIHKADIASALETYNLMSQRFFTHATPTLFNAGTPRPQLSSCFLLTMKDDSIDGIYDTLKNCACISKFAGGIGLSIHNVRATHSYIGGTNGTSNGIVPMLKVFNDTARYVDQGGGKRKGSFAVYLEPWHADVFDFLELKKNTGKDEARARDLFYALWIPDLFMQRVESGGQWSLFCPNEAPGLSDVVGEDFKRLYESYEAQGRARKTIPAQTLWWEVLKSQVETGVPYMLYKDAANLKSNQQNLGVIKSSNLCTEIIEYTSPDEIAVCNLASIALNMMVDNAGEGGAAPTFNFQRLVDISRVVTKNLNKVIDVNYYPVQEARNSNLRHRPIGIGVQGLADCFALMRMPFESKEARELNRDIFEAIYYGACDASCTLAQEAGAYTTFPGSPASQGRLQFDMWGVTPSARFDWAALKARIATHGMRNSLLLAPMPTASTAQILGNNESTEPFTSNVYSRRVLAGEFPVVNKHLLTDLIHRGLWTPAVRLQIIADRGSVQSIKGIPEDIRQLYKTVWEIKQKTIIDQAADRGAFICQSQSLNIHIAEPNNAVLTSMHFYAWKSGLKTGMYYLRSRPKSDAIQFTVDQTALEQARASTAVVGGAFLEGKPVVSLGGGSAASSAPGAAASAASSSGGSPGPQPLHVAPLSSPNTPVATGKAAAGTAAATASEGGASTDCSADSSRVSSPVPMVGFQTPTSARSPVGAGAAAKAAALGGGVVTVEVPASAAGGTPGAGSPEEQEDARLMAIREAKLAERQRQREAMAKAEAEVDSEVCLNCGS